MVQVRVRHSLSPGEHERVSVFLDAAYARDGSRLNDHLASDFAQGGRAGFLAAIATTGDRVHGYAQASAANDGTIVGSVVAPGDEHTESMLLRALLAELPAGRSVTWWGTVAALSSARALGMRPDRRLLQMTRALPIAATTDVAVRAFRVGADEPAWLEMNNAAFAWHGEQGGWDLSTLEQREHEAWFDAGGLLIHELGGRLAAFCWTKLHPGANLVGEIYVIAVHPDFHGLGLGRALTVAGLAHLQSAGATSAMLYVDADNTSAVGLYRSLGFGISRTDQSYLRPPQGVTP